jgi:hypothetical protein
MKCHIKNILSSLSVLTLAVLLMVVAANAQPAPKDSPEANKSADTKSTDTKASQAKNSKSTDTKAAKKTTETTPTSATVGEDAGSFTVVSTIEVGARGLRVDGDTDKFRSDLNYHAGARLFDSSFLMKSKDGKSGLFDTLLVTSSGFGADPNGNMRINVENPKWYRFEGSYRRFKYFRYLNNIVNPNYLFTGFPVPPNPVTGYHGYNTETQFGDFDLTILPKNETIRFTVGYSPERYSGPYFTTYHQGGNEFSLVSQARTRANDFRVGADGKLGPIDWTFLQGFRRFRDDGFSDAGLYINPNPTNIARFTSFLRSEPTRGSVDYTRFSMHTLVAKKLDITGRLVHSSATANSTFLENETGTNFSTRIGSGSSAQLGPPNVLVLGQYNIPSTAKRPNTLADIGVTLLATNSFRVSNTFRFEDFTVDGVATFNDIFTVSRGTTVDSRSSTNLGVNKTTKYRKYQDTFEGDYQFTKNYSMHFGYRYAQRHDEQILTGYALNSNAPAPLTSIAACPAPAVTCAKDDIESNHTNAFFGGFKARPKKNWTLYLDAEHGTADNVFTRIGNYDYTNVRFKSRFAPNRKLTFNVGAIIRNNANPSEIAGVSVSDFGVDLRTRIFQSSVDWLVNPRLQISTGYNYNWVNSDAVIDYFYQVPPAVSTFHHFGHALYFQRNNYFFIDTTSRLNRRMTLYTSYRVNQDGGQGSRISDPTGGAFVSSGSFTTVLGGTLISSYPMSFQSPEGRLSIKLNRRFDWNLGYQYINYNESKFPLSPKPQNYHAHLPYMSLRLYFGRKE